MNQTTRWRGARLPKHRRQRPSWRYGEGALMKPRISMRSALEAPELFGNILPGDSWFRWRCLLIAMVGEPLVNDAEREAFKELTGGREHEPGEMVEVMLVI